MIISGGGGLALPKFAPNLTYFSDKVNSSLYQIASGIDATGALTEVLSLTGKFYIGLLFLNAIASNDLQKIKLTVDGVVIWNESGLASNGANEPMIGISSAADYEAFVCEASFLLEIQMTSDVDIDIIYRVIPIT